jgi:hypothetical protein
MSGPHPDRAWAVNPLPGLIQVGSIHPRGEYGSLGPGGRVPG